MNIEVGKFYRTRDGRKAWVAGKAPVGLRASGFTFCGFVHQHVYACSWDEAGHVISHSELDLVSEWHEPKTATVDVWVHLFHDRDVAVNQLRYDDSDIIGRKKVTVTVTEGDKE